MWVRSLLLLLGCLLWQKDSVDVGQDTSRGNGDLAKQLAQLLIVAHCQLDVPWYDPGLLVVTSSIACQLKDLSCQVLQDCSQVYGCTSSDPLGVLALLEIPEENLYSSKQLPRASCICSM